VCEAKLQHERHEQQTEDSSTRTPANRSTASQIRVTSKVTSSGVKKAQAEAEGLTQQQFNERMNDPDLYQLEDPSTNRSHRFEKPK